MKKIILSSLLLTSLAFGEAQIYLGTGYAYMHENTKKVNPNLDESISSNVARVKIGYGSRDSFGVEFNLDYITGDEKKYGLNIELLKAFDFGIYVNPFFKAGFGSGFIDNKDNANKSYTFGSFNLGTGIFVPLNETFEFELAYEYKNLSYEKEVAVVDTPNRTSHLNNLYIGINSRF